MSTDGIANGTNFWQRHPRRILEHPVLITLAGKIGQASPQPIDTTTSAAWTNSSVQGFGNSWEISIPTSAIADGGSVNLCTWLRAA